MPLLKPSFFSDLAYDPYHCGTLLPFVFLIAHFLSLHYTHAGLITRSLSLWVTFDLLPSSASSPYIRPPTQYDSSDPNSLVKLFAVPDFTGFVSGQLASRIRTAVAQTGGEKKKELLQTSMLN